MTWLLLRIVDLFNALAAWYYRRKYGAVARQLGRAPHEQDGQRGFVIIETRRAGLRLSAAGDARRATCPICRAWS